LVPPIALAVLYLTVVTLYPTGQCRARWTNRWNSASNAFDGRLSTGRPDNHPTRYYTAEGSFPPST
jgi:hypothetical protein